MARTVKVLDTTPTAIVRVDKLTRNYYLGTNGGTTRANGEYRTFRGAVKAATRKGYKVLNETIDPMIEFLYGDKKTKVVTNAMSGKLARIPLNAPLCCDPSSETYWSM